jgi:RNA ligase.
MYKLLTRDAFRESVFARDGHKCILCKSPAVDAHHVIERRLFPDGGYYLSNGASVCESCHLRCEATLVSCEEVRAAAGIKQLVLPPHLYADAEQAYDKWGNPILPNGQRLRGELFDDASVQKVLAPVLHLFTNRVKYPRTWHLPFSPGMHDDDRMIESTAHFVGQRVVVTEKLDGENTTIYRDYVHARSLDYAPRVDRDWVRALAARIGYELDEDYRVCGENLWGTHAIKYTQLPSYFMVFSLWDGLKCLPWDDTKDWAALLGLQTVPVLFDGIWDENLIRKLHQKRRGVDESEGFVVRLAGSFHYRDFRHAVAKYVRAGHVAGSHAYTTKRIFERNGLVR